MLEKMNEFFDRRVGDYDEHMLRDIESATEFYPFTASLLPIGENVELLDLGCGTGLELGYFFEQSPSAKVTGIDLSREMLARIREKFPNRALTLIEGSYFDLPLGKSRFDAAVSVESLHHFTADEKRPLYKKLARALKPGGRFVLTDYFAPSDEDERRLRAEYMRLRAEQGIADGEFYHFDTPLTPEHEIEILREVGFDSVEVVGHWENTYTLIAKIKEK